MPPSRLFLTLIAFFVLTLGPFGFLARAEAQTPAPAEEPAYQKEISSTNFIVPSPEGFRKLPFGSDAFAEKEKNFGTSTLVGFWHQPTLPDVQAFLEWRPAENTKMIRRTELQTQKSAWEIAMAGGKLPLQQILDWKVVSMQPLATTNANKPQARYFLAQADLTSTNPGKPGLTAITGQLLLKAHRMHFSVLGPSGNAAETKRLTAVVEAWLAQLVLLNPSNVEEAASENETGSNDWWGYRWTFVGAALMICLAAFYAREKLRTGGLISSQL